MTDKHSTRANGDSFFTVEDLDFLKNLIDFSKKKTFQKTDMEYSTLMAIIKEKAYIEATKCKTIGC